MKEWKNKEVIIGLIALIILCIVAIVLILKREFPDRQKNQSTYETDIENADQKQELSKTDNEKETDPIPALGLKTEDANSLQEYYTAPKYIVYKGKEIGQLEELFFYWDEYKLDAVNDLIHLPRLRTAFTNELTGTNGFYYYGDLNKDGLPEGKGVSVYENNAYYCGEWKNGKRHGKGMWLQIFPDKAATVNGVTGVIEHSYNGQWQNDLPNGEGQEHIEYDLEQMEGEDILLNVIGSFKDGYYDKDLYIMTIDKTGSTTDWEASAKKGVFNYFHKRYSTTGKLPVWQMMEEPKEGTRYRWLDEPENVNWGIFSLKQKN